MSMAILEYKTGSLIAKNIMLRPFISTVLLNECGFLQTMHNLLQRLSFQTYLHVTSKFNG
jgi:hypothetical protein